MEAVREWAVGICAMAIIGAVLLRFVTNEGAGRALSFVCGVCFLCTVLIPLLKIPFADPVSRLMSDAAPPEVLADTADEQRIAMLEETLTQTVRARMPDGVSVIGVEAVRNKEADGGIYIEKIIIHLSEDSDPVSLDRQLALQAEWGVSVGVTYGY